MQNLTYSRNKAKFVRGVSEFSDGTFEENWNFKSEGLLVSQLMMHKFEWTPGFEIPVFPKGNFRAGGGRNYQKPDRQSCGRGFRSNYNMPDFYDAATAPSTPNPYQGNILLNEIGMPKGACSMTFGRSAQEHSYQHQQLLMTRQ